MTDYKILQQHYERKLAEFGPTSKGMDWPNNEDLDKRFKVLTDIVDDSLKNPSILDLGCGVGLLLPFLRENRKSCEVNYFGSDISSKMIAFAKEQHPDFQFEVRDTLENPYRKDQFDYVIMNGVLTEKQSMTLEEMITFAQKIIFNSFQTCKKGLAFNVMSSHVDWERDDLFHWELDSVVDFLVKKCSRNIRIHMDYGLYEYIVHVKK